MNRKYFRKRDGTFYTKQTKEEIKKNFDINNPDTYIPILKELDRPYFSKMLEICNPKFGSYINWMASCSFRYYGFEDSNLLSETLKEIYK